MYRRGSTCKCHPVIQALHTTDHSLRNVTGRRLQSGCFDIAKAFQSNSTSAFFGENVVHEYAALWTTEDEAESKLSVALEKQLVARLHEAKRIIDDWGTSRWNSHDNLVGAPRSCAVTPSRLVFSCLRREDLLYFYVEAGWDFKN